MNHSFNGFSPGKDVLGWITYSTLSQSEGQMLIDIMNNHGLEQIVHFPPREKNTLVNFKISTSLTNLVIMTLSQKPYKISSPLPSSPQ